MQVPWKYINIFSAGILMWFCQDTKVVQRICEGGENIQAVETNIESVPDDVVDVDVSILDPKILHQGCMDNSPTCRYGSSNANTNLGPILASYSKHS